MSTVAAINYLSSPTVSVEGKCIVGNAPCLVIRWHPNLSLGRCQQRQVIGLYHPALLRHCLLYLQELYQWRPDQIEGLNKIPFLTTLYPNDSGYNWKLLITLRFRKISKEKRKWTDANFEITQIVELFDIEFKEPNKNYTLKNTIIKHLKNPHWKELSNKLEIMEEWIIDVEDRWIEMI